MNSCASTARFLTGWDRDHTYSRNPSMTTFASCPNHIPLSLRYYDQKVKDYRNGVGLYFCKLPAYIKAALPATTSSATTSFTNLLLVLGIDDLDLGLHSVQIIATLRVHARRIVVNFLLLVSKENSVYQQLLLVARQSIIRLK